VGQHEYAPLHGIGSLALPQFLVCLLRALDCPMLIAIHSKGDVCDEKKCHSRRCGDSQFLRLPVAAVSGLPQQACRDGCSRICLILQSPANFRFRREPVVQLASLAKSATLR
jgi:hypothetical protein